MADEKRFGWFANVPPGARLSTEPPPWVRTEPRTPADPYPLRVFTDEGAFPVWGPMDEPLPGMAWEEEGPGLERTLPISVDLRGRLVEWARLNTLVRGLTASELDWMGYHLSRELATTLGELYSVEYHPTCAGPHRAEIRGRAGQEPLAGWRVRVS